MINDNSARPWLATGIFWLAAIGLPLLVGLVLLRTIDHDPARGVTFSNSPFSDEAWRALNARNLVLFGSWSTDDLALHLVQTPLSAVQAIVFSIAGVGLVQARLISVAATVAMTAVFLLGLRRELGLAGAVTAAAAVSMSALSLYYGRLALLEPTVALALSIAAVSAIRVERESVRRWALVCGLALAVAIALKVNAVSCGAGILLAVAVRSLREVDLRHFVAIALGVIIVVAIGWFVVVAVPDFDRLRAVISILPSAAIPATVGEWLHNLVRSSRSNDGIAGLVSPLLVGAALGILLVAITHRGSLRTWTGRLSGPSRVALVGVLWAGFGFFSLASFAYLPNRYAVPVLPGLALIIGSGVSVIATRMERRSALAHGFMIASVLVLLVGPGLIVDAAWSGGTGRKAMEGQAAVERILPAGVKVAGGYAPLFALRAPVVAVVPFLGTTATVNAGDLYADGIRWGFVETGPMPVWVGQHAEAWAARQIRWCTHWAQDDVQVCLIELP